MNIETAGCRPLDRALSLEWLETNGRGGFASGTVAGANTRRYHALLLVARKPPSERVVLVNHLEEWVEHQGGHRTPLSTNLYPGVVHPTGCQSCTGFSLDPWPTWTYAIGDLVIQRELFVPHGRDVVVVRWQRLERIQTDAVLVVRPMLSGRDYHATHHENAALWTGCETQDGQIRWRPYPDLPAVRALHNGAYRHQPDWYRHVQLPVEQQRGLDSEEDWWSPGELSFSLAPGATATLVLTAEEASVPVEQFARDEQRLRKSTRKPPTGDALADRLRSATDAFLCVRGSGHTIVAGYPWFTDWGRDAFISLPGLCLVTGRYETAWQIIQAFGAAISRGMVPNRFPDAGEEPEYNTIDASLWFIHALDRYLLYSGDLERVEAVGWPAVQAIVNGYRDGTRFNIHRDADGLITGGEPGAQLTWMDAKVGEWVVTPRHGKPVEVQALWIRALSVGEKLAEKFGDQGFGERCRRDRRQAIASFRARFWYEAGGYLYDVVDGPDGDDPSLRPNQLYPIALCDGLLTSKQARQAVQVVEAQLLTPVGLRTLAPSDPRYRPRCQGTVPERDGAYHQGTVWPFLLGVFVTAWLKVNGTRVSQKTKARQCLNGLAAHVEQACLGQVSEIFDGDAPHAPGGCPAQAWSVAEPLRALMEDLGTRPSNK